ncbi:hypothetical protein Tco_1408357 [Tanacetum coccineum]
MTESGIKSEKQDESNRSGNDTHAEDGKINKDALEIDNKVAGASHDKDNITEVQSSNNEMFENVFAHDHGQKHVDEKTKTDNKTLKEENILLKKETETVEQQNNEKLQKEKDEIRAVACNPKLYDAHVLRQEFMKLDMHDTGEILNDAEESQVKMKEKQFPEITAEVKEMLDIFESMESEVDETSKKHENFQNMIDQLLEANIANDVRDLVMQSYMELRKEKKLNVDSSPSSIGESNIFEFEKESGEKKNLCENAKCELQTKIVELEKVLIQQKKDFDDVKLELSNIMTKFEAYFEKLENTKVFLERQLARKIDDSKAEKDQLLREINLLRTQLKNLEGKSVETKFDKPSI